MHTPSRSYKLNSPVSTNVLLDSSSLEKSACSVFPIQNTLLPSIITYFKGPVQNLPPPWTVSYLIPATSVSNSNIWHLLSLTFLHLVCWSLCLPLNVYHTEHTFDLQGLTEYKAPFSFTWNMGFSFPLFFLVFLPHLTSLQKTKIEIKEIQSSDSEGRLSLSKKSQNQHGLPSGSYS